MFNFRIHLLVVLITILLILPLIHSEVITIKVNGPSIDISLKQPNLDVSSYQVITLDNGFRLLTIANPTLKGVTTFGVTANVGGLENPPYTRNLNFMLSNYLAAGSQQYPNANEMNEFFAPQNVFWYVPNTRGETSSLATVPNQLAEKSISYIIGSYLNPIFSEDGLKSIIQTQIDSISQQQQGSAQLLFIEYFANSTLNQTWKPNAKDILLKTPHQDLNKTLVDQYNTFFSSDNMAGCVVFEKYNQTLVELIVAQLKSLPNRQAKDKINKDYIPLRQFTDDTKIYMKFNSTKKRTLSLNIIPVGEDGKQQQNYGWIKLLLNLINNRQGFKAQLQAQFKEIKSISSQLKYLNRKRYPVIALDITLQDSSQDSSVNIYNYAFAYLKQDWSATYAQYGLDLIRDLQYTFHKSPFSLKTDVYWDWLLQFNSYLRNLLQYGIPHTLDGEYFVDTSILNTPNSHSFKLVAIQFGDLSQKDGQNAFTGLAFKYITPTDPLPKVSSAKFTPNPYNLGIPATPQQFPKPQQKWMPYSIDSVTFAPNFFLNLPFSSVTAVLHYKLSKNNAFPRVFFSAVESYLEKDINYIYDSNIRLIENRQLYSFGLVGLKDNLFLLFGKLARTLSSDFCSQKCFAAALESAKADYSNFYNSSSISEILDDEQAHLENPSLSSNENSLKLLQDYGYDTFLAEQKVFVKGISWEWLVITFKEQIGDFSQAVIVLHAQNSIPYYKSTQPTKSTACPATKTFTHPNINKNAIRFYYNLGSNSLQNIYSTHRFLQSFFFVNDTSDNFQKEIHYTVDGNIGFNIEFSSATKNNSILLQKLQDIQDKLSRFYTPYEDMNFFYKPMIPIKEDLKRKQFSDISQQQAKLIFYIHVQCYKCLTSWNQNQGSNYWNSLSSIKGIFEKKCQIAVQSK